MTERLPYAFVRHSDAAHDTSANTGVAGVYGDPRQYGAVGASTAHTGNAPLATARGHKQPTARVRWPEDLPEGTIIVGGVLTRVAEGPARGIPYESRRDGGRF